MNARTLILTVACMGTLAVAGCTALLWWSLRAPLPPADLVDRPAPERVHHTHAAAAPSEHLHSDGPAQREPVAQIEEGSVLLDGWVLEPDGTPVERARVRAGAVATHTGADGSYTLWVQPAQVQEIEAQKQGYLGEERPLHLPPDQGATIDFVLHREATVTVYCAGLPDDSCRDVKPGILCTHPALLLGRRCRDRDPMICECPAGGAALRGGGEAVRVQEGQRVAWLDFRYGGALSGVVLVDGEPNECRIEAYRVPGSLLEELPRGLLAARVGHCEEDGGFLLEGLKAGTWRLDINGYGERMVLPEIEVGDDLSDLGELELTQQGRIEGVLLDALTGAPVPWTPVWATMADEDAFALPSAHDNTDGEGRFVIKGLPDGGWSVYRPPYTWEAVEVRVIDGAAREVELWQGNDAAPDGHGFTLQTGGAGELLIGEVAPVGPMAGTDLAPGDVVQQVKLLGFDVSRLHPSAAHKLLEYYPGPGVSLVLERNGREHTVTLD